jgi:SAM-dependent methyltransferase
MRLTDAGAAQTDYAKGLDRETRMTEQMEGSPAERWWQEHGGAEWLDEISKRRRLRPIYHLQEMFLSRFFRAMQRPLRVLDFGCGYGRHLEYLRRNPNLELYGCDQSEKMLQSARELLGPEDPVAQRLAVTDPHRPLPYPDRAFDLTYTVSVLIHVPPEVLPFTLSELVRVTRHSILHIESNVSAEERLISPIHDGCWAHNLSYAYRKLGAPCVTLPKHFADEDVYLTVLAADPAIEPVVDEDEAQQSLALDRNLSQGLQEYEGELARLHQHITRADDLEATMHDYRRRVRMILDSAQS